MNAEFPCRLRIRPECEADIKSLEDLITDPLGPDRLVLVNPAPADASESAKLMHQLGGMVWEFEARSADEAAHLISCMARVPDGHRMLQTIDLADAFTGDAFDGEAERAQRITALIGADHDDALEAYRMFMPGVEASPGTP